MRYLKYAALLAICMFVAAAPSHAQRVVVGVGVGPAYYGPAPVCAYGYYGYYPYACAPYGYYGRDFDHDRGFRGREGFEHRGFDRGGFRGGDRGFHGGEGFHGGSRDFHGSDHGGGRGHGWGH